MPTVEEIAQNLMEKIEKGQNVIRRKIARMNADTPLRSELKSMWKNGAGWCLSELEYFEDVFAFYHRLDVLTRDVDISKDYVAWTIGYIASDIKWRVVDLGRALGVDVNWQPIVYPPKKQE